MDDPPRFVVVPPMSSNALRELQAKHRTTRTLNGSRYDQIDAFKVKCEEVGALYVTTVMVPAFNYWNQQIGEYHLYVYCHHDNICFAIYT